MFYLSRPIPILPGSEAFPDGPIESSWRSVIPFLHDAWISTKVLPAEEKTGFSCDDGAMGFQNKRHLPCDFLMRNRALPTTMLETARLWVNQSPACVAALRVLEYPGRLVGDRRIVELTLGSLYPDLLTLPTEEVLAGLSEKSSKPGGYRFWLDRRNDCERELYRRLMADRDATLPVLLKERTLEKEIMGEANLFEYLISDLRSIDESLFGDVFAEVFKHAKRDVKQNMLDHPGYYGKGFWETLTHSDDQEVREKAESVLNDIREEEEAMKKAEKKER